METFWAGVVAVVVAFFTTLLTEPLRLFLNRNKHGEETRLENQVAALPKYITALGWAMSTCSNVNFGWQRRDLEPFEYSGRALEKMIEAANLGMDTAYLFEEPLRTEIIDLSKLLKVQVNEYMILRDATSPKPDKDTSEMRKLFSDLTPQLSVEVTRMEKEYRRLLKLD